MRIIRSEKVQLTIDEQYNIHGPVVDTSNSTHIYMILSCRIEMGNRLLQLTTGNHADYHFMNNQFMNRN